MHHKLHNARRGRVSLMVLSKAAPPRIARPRASVGRPVGAETRAIEGRARRHEDREAWGRVRTHARHIHLAVVADRPDLALHSAGAIVSLAERRLRQLDGNDAA